MAQKARSAIAEEGGIAGNREFFGWFLLTSFFGYLLLCPAARVVSDFAPHRSIPRTGLRLAQAAIFIFFLDLA
jgi:hypothetical protein